MRVLSHYCPSVFLSATALLLAALPLLAQPRLGKGQVADVQADKLAIEHQKRLARFEGHVRAVYGELTLHCDQMVLSYSAKGEILTLRAEGRVTVRRDSTKATARVARLDASRALLIMEGSPVLERGPHRLEGTTITVHLETSRIDVTEARGTFKLGTGKAP